MQVNKSKINYSIYFIFCLFIVLQSCSQNKKDGALARVYDKYLYADDVVGIVPKSLKGKDSANMMNDYINSWIEKNVELKKAENNLEDAELDVEQQLQDYRSSLINYKFERALVNQKLDTVVNSNDIADYYEHNKQNFELKDNIIKVWYIKVKKNVSVIAKMKNLYKTNNEKNKKILEDLCMQYAENSYFKEDAWLLFDDLLKEIPIKTYDKEQYLQNNCCIEMNDANYIYLVNIIDFKIKDSVSPLAFETQNIRNIILNKRKLQLIESMKLELLNDAKNNKEVEVY